MRKLMVILMTVVLAAALLLASCSTPAPSPTPSPKPTTPTASPAPSPAPSPQPSPAPTGVSLVPTGELAKYVTMGGSTTGTVGILGGGFVGVLKKYSTIDSTYRGMAGGVPAAQALAKGDVDMLVYSAVQPLEVIRDLNKQPLRTLTAAADPSVTIIGIFTSPKTGIKTVADLKGKRFLAENPAYSTAAKVSEGALKANGMTKDDVKWLKFDNADDAAKQVVEGLADAYCYVLGTSSQILKDGTGDAVALPLGPKEVAAIQELVPALLPGPIPAGRSGVSKETPAVIVNLAFFAMPTMSEKTAYTVVQVLYEHIADFQAVHAQAKGFTLQNALYSFAAPFHSGAIKYYKEKGVWTAAEDEKQRQAIAAEEKAIGKTIPDTAAYKALGILK